MNVKIKLCENGKMPKFAHEDDACADCYARISDNFITIPAHSRCLINLGFALEIPIGYEAVIRPRSGLTKMGIDNAIGTIDSNFRGEIKAGVINNTDAPFSVWDGDRICQIAIRKTEQISFEQVDELSDTDRGSNGFGSTGIK